MRIFVGVVATLVLLVLTVALIGWSLPVRHRVSRSATLPVPPDAVFAVITDFGAFPSWRAKVKRVELVELPGGGRGFRESGADGDILFAVDEAAPNRRLVTRIVDNANELPFAGTWTYELIPTATAGGTTLLITEDGEVFNPIFRFVSRFVLSHHATVDAYITDLGRKFGAPVVIEPSPPETPR